MPSVQNLGDTVIFNATVFAENNLGNLTIVGDNEYKSEINCAYDPNDKLVIPTGVGSPGQILFDEELLKYTVRLQNTGTDTAFTIRIEDQLDEELD